MDYNRAGGTAFAAWGLLHVVVGAVALGVFVTGGAEAMLQFVNLDPAANAESVRMSHLIVQFYQALLLIGLTVAVVGLTLNRRGEPVGLALNTVLVVGIDAFFVWYEVIPGNRPVILANLSIGRSVFGAGFGWLGLRANDGMASVGSTGESAG
jgi:hypothetical protein